MQGQILFSEESKRIAETVQCLPGIGIFRSVNAFLDHATEEIFCILFRGRGDGERISRQNYVSQRRGCLRRQSRILISGQDKPCMILSGPDNFADV